MSGLAALALAAAVWPGHGARVHVRTTGKFDARPADLANHINEPVTAAKPPELPLPVSPEALAAINAHLVDATDAVLTSLGAQVQHGDKALEKLRGGAKTITDGEGDDRFSLLVEAAPDTSVGGHLGGLDVRVTVRSLQRASDIEGHGGATVPAEHDADAAVLGLRGALMDAVSSAFVDLRGHLGDEQTRPRVPIALRFSVAGLDAASRRDAVGLLRCASELASPVTSTVVDAGPDELRANLEIRRSEPNDDARSLAQSLAGTLGVEIGPNGKDRCSTWHTQLHDRIPVVLSGPGEVRVRFELPDGGS